MDKWMTYSIHAKQKALACPSIAENRPLPTARCLLPTIHRPLPADSGVILIALLWILTALSVIALSFSRESFIEVAAGRNAQSLEMSYFIARAGIETTIYQLLQKRSASSVQATTVSETPDPLDLGTAQGNFAGGSYQVDIQDESGKININMVSEQQLLALVEAAEIGQPDAGIISDSILDWRDADTAHRLNGAEDDYYQTMNPPYKARNNGRIDTVEELLLVRGITPEYFYGRSERTPDGSVNYRYGLSRLLTTYSTRGLGQININFAPLAVLKSIPGMPVQAAQMIYDRRRNKPFKDVAEMTREIPISLSAQALQLLTTGQSGILTLTASAHTENSKARRTVRTIISLSPGANTLYQTLYWNENVSDYESIAP
jgi:general secretion pathway protein K